MRKINVTRLFEETFRADRPVIIHRGGARSSKSYSVIQYLVYRLTNEPDIKMIIARKTLPALKVTAQKVFIDLLNDYGYMRYCNYNRSDNMLIYKPTNGFVLFASVQDPERLKSSEWNVVFMEEANEFTFNDYMILRLRLSAPSNSDLGNKIILALNPVDAFNWVKTELVDKDTNNVEEIVSNYKDNPFLSDDYINLLNSMKDPYYRKVYINGKWGVLKNLIFPVWEEVDVLPPAEKTIYGCDFGYSADQTAIVETRFTKDGVYVKELLYQLGMTNSDLIEWMQTNLNPSVVIYCDTAEPQRIEELRRAGLNARDAQKGPDSVRKSIDTINTQNLYISSDSVNLIKEMRSYRWAEDRSGKTLNRPVEGFDHLVDAVRYAIYTYLANKQSYTLITGSK